MRVTLELHEILLGAQAGVMRQVENKKLGRQPAYGAGHDNDWNLNVEGCLGEMALAKALKGWWAGKGEFRAPDVVDMDVRTTRHDNGCLILHPNDPDHRRFYLVTGMNGEYQVRGWIVGQSGKVDRYWKDPTGTGRPAWFVPQSALNPIK